MCLHMHSDAPYLSALKAKQRSSGFNFSQRPPQGRDRYAGSQRNTTARKQCPRSFRHNEAHPLLRHRIRNMRRLLQLETRHYHLDNARRDGQNRQLCAAGIANKTMKQRCSRAINMRFYWVHDGVEQGPLVLWQRRPRRIVTPLSRSSSTHALPSSP